MLDQSLPEGATPIQDSGGLKLSWIKTRDQLNEVERKIYYVPFQKRFPGEISLLSGLQKRLCEEFTAKCLAMYGIGPEFIIKGRSETLELSPFKFRSKCMNYAKM